MPRLFVAIDLPEEVKTQLSGFSRELTGCKWVGMDELHLTLRFIGEVDDGTFALIGRALTAVRFESFPLTLCGVGHFPPHKHPRVLWVGIQGGEELGRLQQNVELALIEAGISPDDRPFSPHITLARMKDTAPSDVARFERDHAGLVCPTFEVSEFILYSSVLSRTGAIHTKEQIYRCR
jgi:RNA 2',3'-cyclic 3'-phosphodiesterase